jgi:hypothetical protein
MSDGGKEAEEEEARNRRMIYIAIVVLALSRPPHTSANNVRGIY